MIVAPIILLLKKFSSACLCSWALVCLPKLMMCSLIDLFCKSYSGSLSDFQKFDITILWISFIKKEVLRLRFYCLIIELKLSKWKMTSLQTWRHFRVSLNIKKSFEFGIIAFLFSCFTVVDLFDKVFDTRMKIATHCTKFND